jgi:hypothetical protein
VTVFTIQRNRCSDSPGIAVQIAPESVFTLLRNGCSDWAGTRTIEPELVALGVKADDLSRIKEKYVAPIVFDGMPVQEAIEFTAFILRTTIGMSKFEAGIASCGGPLWSP